MKRLLVFAAAAVLVLPMTAVAGQSHGAGGGGGAHAGGGGGGAHGGGGHASAPSAPSGGGSTSSAGAGSGGTTAAPAGGSSGGRAEGAARPGSWRSGATGGSGTVMPRAVARPQAESANPGAQTAGVPRHSRPSEGAPTTGTAAPRGPNNPRPGTQPTYIVPGYYGGYGFYDPWLVGGLYGAYYGGFYGGYYDPWFGGGYVPSTTYSYQDSEEEGSLRLKIKPRNAEVYVDGYYVGIVDDFDGIFQRLHLDSGTHRVEVRADGYETLTFDVRVTPDHTTTYQGELKRLQ